MKRMAIFHARRCFSRSLSSLSSHPLRVCVVGSGPAGFYTAEKLLKAHQRAEVDIVDRLPTPFGLVRSGVAPDHQETKIVMNQFTRVALNERCSFFGNVSLGTSISLSELRDMYHVVVLAYGAESDRVLGVSGEDLDGIYSAREFVWWYNGHPDCSSLVPDLKRTDTAVVLGQEGRAPLRIGPCAITYENSYGIKEEMKEEPYEDFAFLPIGNVALDVARILLRSTTELATTDIANHALAALQESSIRKVYLVGRRGPVQAACTAKELREILGIKNLSIHIHESDLHKSTADEEEMKNSRIQKRVYELLSKAATSQRLHPASGDKELHFVFFRRPDSFLHSKDSNGKVTGVRFEQTILAENGGSGTQSAVGTGQFEELECGLVLKSIGYKSVPVHGLPFDHRKGVVPNFGGRVVSNTSVDPGILEKGLYVTGWLKRGPTGIIATNLYCAEETVASISEDLEHGLLTPDSVPKPGRDGLLQLLDNRDISFVPFSEWEKIDLKEKSEGSLKNKPREKITNWEDLLKVAKS